MLHAIESMLYRWGYFVPEVRRMVALQLAVAVVALMLLPLGGWGRDFCIGAVLGTLNFLALARFIQELVFLRRGAVLSLLVGFYARLILTAVALYVVLILWHASVAMVLMGLATVIVNILLWGIVHFLGRTSKEA
ncbi:MAG TPA: hypothetical protein DEU72_07310 [Desulfomicrobiaceae bacterium]|jgi:hypothetical protein|nr:hypothetical protein [Desulfomicrobiaceae bacterium]